ncbi:MAG: phosphatidate cytidylyltransferase [Candidatus Kapaibacterium sp.]
MSNTLTRVLISVIGIPLILVLVYMGGYALFALILLLQTLCFYELLIMFREKKLIADIYTSVLLSIITITFYTYYREYFNSLFIIAVLFTFLLIALSSKENKVKTSGLVLFGLVYITVPFTMLFELSTNYLLVFLLLFLIWANDSFAFFGGKYFGKHKFSKISPNKTVEGLISGFVFTVLTAIVFHLITKEITLTDSLVIGSLISVLAPTGDLFESFLKRYNGIKDSSSIIPGHGGILDRFDSLIFCTPFVYIYFKHIKYLIN